MNANRGLRGLEPARRRPLEIADVPGADAAFMPWPGG
jgi:hypothetical protein